MRKLVVTENITLDGVIDASGGWFAPGDDTADLARVAAVLRQQSAEFDALLPGRVSFEQVRAFWPHQANDTTGIAAQLDQVQKHVVSATKTKPGWDNTTVLRGPIADEIAALKQQQGKDIVTTGSITLVHELIALGLPARGRAAPLADPARARGIPPRAENHCGPVKRSHRGGRVGPLRLLATFGQFPDLLDMAPSFPRSGVSGNPGVVQPRAGRGWSSR